MNAFAAPEITRTSDLLCATCVLYWLCTAVKDVECLHRYYRLCHCDEYYVQQKKKFSAVNVTQQAMDYWQLTADWKHCLYTVGSLFVSKTECKATIAILTSQRKSTVIQIRWIK